MKGQGEGPSGASRPLQPQPVQNREQGPQKQPTRIPAHSCKPMRAFEAHRHVYMCICMYVCMGVYIHVQTNRNVRIHMCIHIYMCMYVYIETYLHVDI